MSVSTLVSGKDKAALARAGMSGMEEKRLVQLLLDPGTVTPLRLFSGKGVVVGTSTLDGSLYFCLRGSSKTVFILEQGELEWSERAGSGGFYRLIEGGGAYGIGLPQRHRRVVKAFLQEAGVVVSLYTV